MSEEVDRSHLHALEEGLFRERQRLERATTESARAIRRVWVAQLEREIAAEREHLGLQEESPTDGEKMSDEELLQELSRGSEPDNSASRQRPELKNRNLPRGKTTMQKNIVDLNFFSLLDDVSEGEVTPALSVEPPLVDEVPDVSRIVRNRVRGGGGVTRRVSAGTSAASPRRAEGAAGAVKITPPQAEMRPVVAEPVPELTLRDRLADTIHTMTPRGVMRIANLESEDGTEAVRAELLEIAAAGNVQSMSDCAAEWMRQRHERLDESARNFSYERGESIAPSGRVSRIRANLAAIKLMKELEAADRLPTKEEKSVLAAYAGWGADKEVFNTSRVEFRRYKSTYSQAQMESYFPEYVSWEKEYGAFFDEIKTVLTEAEWSAAAASVLNAHYTSEEVCHSLWDIVKQSGFRGGNVLEPAIGTGAIVGAMPEEYRAKTFVTGVELDSVSARIAKKLYPESRIHECGFEHARQVAPNSQDLVITNVPFSDVGPANQTGVEFNLHNFFISESLKKLKPGGFLVAITSASTMENNPEQLEELASRAELMGAIRLPSNAFSRRANTEVVTDILVIRKPVSEQLGEETWSQVLPMMIDEDVRAVTAKGEEVKTTLVNEYFVRIPKWCLADIRSRARCMVEAKAGNIPLRQTKAST